jgi:hypothetical protein
MGNLRPDCTTAIPKSPAGRVCNVKGVADLSARGSVNQKQLTMKLVALFSPVRDIAMVRR